MEKSQENNQIRIVGPRPLEVLELGGLSACASPLADPHRRRWPYGAQLRAQTVREPGSGRPRAGPGSAPVDIGARGQNGNFCPTFFPEKHKIRPDGHFLRVWEKCRRRQKWRGKAPGHSQHSGIVKIRTFFRPPKRPKSGVKISKNRSLRNRHWQARWGPRP